MPEPLVGAGVWRKCAGIFDRVTRLVDSPHSTHLGDSHRRYIASAVVAKGWSDFIPNRVIDSEDFPV